MGGGSGIVLHNVQIPHLLLKTQKTDYKPDCQFLACKRLVLILCINFNLSFGSPIVSQQEANDRARRITRT